MKSKSIITAALGAIVIAASLTVAGAQARHSAPIKVAAESQPKLVQVYIASSDIAYGDDIDLSLVATQSWPREALPALAFVDEKAMLGTEGQPARQAKTQIFQGEIILASKVTNFGETLGFTHTLGPNTRAMSIKVDAVTAVSGFVSPGDRVDIVLTKGRNESMQAATILQNVRVVGIDQSTEKDTADREVARTVTVEVSAPDGEILALSQNLGTLSLKLRSPDSVDQEISAPVKVSDIFGTETPDVEVPEPPQTVRVRRGLDVSTVTVPTRQ